MRTTITIEDSLLEEAAKIAGDNNTSSLITTALKSFIAAESKKRILRLSGKAPGFNIPGRDSRLHDLDKVAESADDYQS